MKNYASSKISGPASEDEDDFQAKQDAETLQKHAEIHSDPDRLQKAMTHLSATKKNVNTAHANGRRALFQKTGQRLKQAFGGEAGEEDGETPFEKAGKNQ